MSVQTTVLAHEDTHGGMQHNESPNLLLSLGMGLRYLDSDEPYPYPRLPGVLEAGSARADESGTDLDYAELGAHASFNPQWSSGLRLTHHGGNDSHTEIESLWLEGGASFADIRGRAGRQEVPLGFENLEHSHSRTFGITPIVMRAAVADAWIADGLRLDWGLSGGWSLGGGLWRNQGYPGVDSGELNLTTLRLGWRNESWRLETSYADADAEGRALITVGEGGHTHSVPSCDTVSVDRVCFNGNARVWNASARWQPVDSAWWIGGELWRKKEQGDLDSIYGVPRYEGEVNGGWIDMGYQITPSLAVNARYERMNVTNYLNGVNAGLIANQVQIASADKTPHGIGMVVEWSPWRSVRLLGEWHRDDADGASNDIVLLRLQMSFEYTHAFTSS
ncbi:MAG: hypothetical protein P8163_15820 [Candidatus Thiodiazotropha sp.]